MPTILGANTLATEGYQVQNSMMLETGDSSRLSKTFSSASNSRTTFTVSGWFKKTKNGATQDLISAFRSSDGFQTDVIRFGSTDDLEFYAHSANSSGNCDIQTGRVFRDVSAWYHVVIRVDTTQSTASNRVRIYVNGVQETVFTSSNYMNQNGTIIWGIGSGVEHTIGAVSTSNFFSGYVAEVVYLDGQSLGPTSFGEFDPQTPTTWRPKDVTGLTYGNNSFYLEFKTAGNIGVDTSGNSNSFDGNNLQQKDQSTDTCTNNFSTMNPLDNYYGAQTYSQGNLQINSPSGNASAPHSTFGVSSGRWYVEAKLDSAGSNQTLIGISSNQATQADYNTGRGATSYGMYSNGGKIYNNNDNGTSYGGSYSAGNIIGIYLDLEDNKLYFSINGTLQNSGTGHTIAAASTTELGNYFFSGMQWDNQQSCQWSFNFGSGPYANSSSNTDDNGHGDFEYSPNITGDGSAKKFYALNSKNLAEFG